MTHTIHQEVVFDAGRTRLFQALTDADQFAAVTGADAVSLGTGAGAPFSLFGGHITGRNVELVPDRRLVQGLACRLLAGGRLLDRRLPTRGRRRWSDQARVRPGRLPRSRA